jgi:hypothetical protein
VRRPSALLIVLGLAVMFVLGVAGLFVKAQIQKHRRETEYQAIAGQYSQALRLGATRQQVEDYLRGKNVRFSRMCCVESPVPYDEAWDDFVFLGQAYGVFGDALRPFFPSAFNEAFWCKESVSVGFQFTTSMHIVTDKRGVPIRRDTPFDTLKNMSIYRQIFCPTIISSPSLRTTSTPLPKS